MEQLHSTTPTRKWKQLTERDRYQIEAYFKVGKPPGEIARIMGRSKRTIEREQKAGLTEQLCPATAGIKAHGDLQIQWVYCADAAQRHHEENSARKGRPLKIGHDHKLAKHIEVGIKKHKRSPGAILGEIERIGLEFSTHICVKTLYNYIDQGLFAEVSNSDLPYKKKSNTSQQKKRSVALNNTEGKSIEERPKEVNERRAFGHWEIDLIVGKAGTKPAVMSLVERVTRKVLYVLIKNKTQKEVIQALRRIQRRICGDFSQVIKSITADNGVEFLDAAGMKRAAKCDEVYYAHPYSSWERGSNENANRMLRRFMPKGTDFRTVTPKELRYIEDWVNNYPRKIFGYRSANDMYAHMMD